MLRGSEGSPPWPGLGAGLVPPTEGAQASNGKTVGGPRLPGLCSSIMDGGPSSAK